MKYLATIFILAILWMLFLAMEASPQVGELLVGNVGSVEAGSEPPVFEQSGLVSVLTTPAAGDSATFTLPATVNANDILIMQLWVYEFSEGTAIEYGTTYDIIEGGGSTTWALADSFSAVSVGDRQHCAWFWLRADGTEDSRVDTVYVIASNDEIAGITSRFSGCITTGDPFEALQSRDTTTASQNVWSQEITTLGDNRLAVSLINVFDNNSCGAWSNYTERIDSGSADGSPDCQFILETQTKETAGLVSFDYGDNTASDMWGSFTFALKPD